jgi:hypothetical protein
MTVLTISCMLGVDGMELMMIRSDDIDIDIDDEMGESTRLGTRKETRRGIARVQFNLQAMIMSGSSYVSCPLSRPCSAAAHAAQTMVYNSASCYSATQTISANPSNSSDIALTTMPRGIDLSKFRGDSDSEDEAFPPVKKQIVLDSFKQQTFSHGIQKKTKKELEKEEEERKRKQEEV